MIIDISLTDREKKALRYLGIGNVEVVEQLQAACSNRIDAYVRRAKAEYLATQTMDDIDPTPI